jgi:hypothetical protein
MNRLFTLTLIGLAGLLASCGSSVSSSTQPGTNDVYSVAMSEDRLTLNAGDWSSITATVDLSYENSAPKPVTPPPTIQFFSSDPLVTVSPAGEVCAGQWDTKYLTCSQTVFPLLNPLAGQLDIPTGQVTITAYNASHNVSGTTLVTVHPRAASITLSAAVGPNASLFQYPPLPTGCVSQNNQVSYVAAPLDANGKAFNVFAANDFTWAVGDPNVAAVSSFGSVIARNPGVTNVYAKLNGTVSVPLAFATCPPSAFVLASSAFTNGKPVAPFSTADLNLSNGSQQYLTATPVGANGTATPLFDLNGVALVTLPLSFITSDTLTGSFTSTLPLTSRLTTNTAGRFDVIAACEPPTCNAAVADFVSPAGLTTGKAIGFGYPTYSNVIGVTVKGNTGSTVLVTGTNFTGGITTPAHRLIAYDSESMAITQTIGLNSVPNSMVVAPNGLKAYLGSDQLNGNNGLMVVDLTSFQSSITTFPIAGGVSTDRITGTVLGVSPDSRYVLVSDVANSLVFLIDTTGTKTATRYQIGGIRAVTFAADDFDFWIAGDTGVYVFNADTFVKTVTSTDLDIKALAWMPDGQSYFASGKNGLTNYSTCDDQTPQLFIEANPINLDATAIGGVSHAIGLSGNNLWADFSATKTPIAGQTIPLGNVCAGTVTVAAPVTVPVTYTVPTPCTATQISFSPRLESEFITGVDPSCATAEPFIHGYAANNQTEITLATLTDSIIPLSGGVLNDGRKLFIGTYDTTAGTAELRRFDLSTGASTTGTLLDGLLKEDTSVSVSLVPSFVAVVPK